MVENLSTRQIRCIASDTPFGVEIYDFIFTNKELLFEASKADMPAVTYIGKALINKFGINAVRSDQVKSFINQVVKSIMTANGYEPHKYVSRTYKAEEFIFNTGTIYKFVEKLTRAKLMLCIKFKVINPSTVDENNNC